MIQYETPSGPVEIRELSTIEDMLAAEQIQLAVWGDDIYPHPKEMLIPVQHEGGLLAGAFSSDGEMIGLVFQFPTANPTSAHSQILAVLEPWRGKGIGRMLKWFQRDWCLEHEITHIRWTVDPLRAANAELNIRHLGGVSSTYLPNYYGSMKGIDAGVPTDRLLVDWFITSPRICALAEAGSPIDTGFPHAEEALVVYENKPLLTRTLFDGHSLLIRLPDDYIQLVIVNPELAMEWRMVSRHIFLEAFKVGYSIRGFTRIGGPAYLLELEVA